MIDLLNQRFVPYYFNRSGQGQGGNAAAAAFTKDKPGNRYAYLAAYLPDGTYLSESALYADKHAVFDWLRGLLAAHPALGRETAAEAALRARGEATDATAAERLAWARLLESLGERTRALSVLAAPAEEADIEAERLRARWRILRSAQEWERLADALLAPVRAGPVAAAVVPDRLAETAYLDLHRKRYAAVQARLRAVIRDHDDGERASDLHFALGKADWFEGERDWARFHWMWIWHQRRDDRLAMRAKIAAAAQVMPYANPELGGFRAEGSIGPQHIEQEHAGSCAIHARLRPFYEAGDWAGPQRAKEAAAHSEAPAALVARLVDGNRHREANNEIVSRLEALGAPALAPLAEAVRRPAFAGRGYAAYALGRVMKTTDRRPLFAQVALVVGLQDPARYVSALSRSGMEQAGLTWETLAEARATLRAEEEAALRADGGVVPWVGDDPAVLARRLRDGNAHRVTNNRIVERLVELGAPSVEPLMAAVRDEAFAGRAYAAWALASVLAPLAARPPAALALLQEVAASGGGALQALAASGLRLLQK